MNKLGVPIVTEGWLKQEYASDSSKIEIKNNIISRVDIEVVAHFGNTVSFMLKGKQGGDLLPLYNSTNIIGKIIQKFLTCFYLEREDGIELSTIRNIPIREVWIDDEKVAIGHFMEDRFLSIKEWLGGDYGNN